MVGWWALKDCKAFCVKMGRDDSEWEERDAKRKTMGEYLKTQVSRWEQMTGMGGAQCKMQNNGRIFLNSSVKMGGDDSGKG